ncbi:NapC/NirT family cytochrome c [Propionivibrio sp.]|uniref:NapC/NirT family cytochrome c n=1 Tax=Propionivibrio sp. TaxID=2212460 RepID=UPI003BF3E3D7
MNLLQKLRARWKLVLGLAVLGFIASVTLVIGGAAGLAFTSTEEFCINCHEMKNNVYAEYKGTIHDQNRTGVRAICTDCHVPRQPVGLILRKIQATGDLYHHFITGSINTREKFEAKRYELATHVWKRMKETDSIECRNCHNADKMSTDLQTPRAQTRHAKAKAENLTCIDCHFGIAHQEPDGPGPQELFPKASKTE